MHIYLGMNDDFELLIFKYQAFLQENSDDDQYNPKEST